jgi:hypothetical protein
MSKKMDVSNITQQLEDSAVAGFARSGPAPLPKVEPEAKPSKQPRRRAVVPLEIPEPAPVGVDTSGGVTDAEREGLSSTHDNTGGSPPVRPDVRTPVQVRRTITRYAYEVFLDQVETLKKISLEEQFRGEKGSMSAMVREAIDMYIAKRKRTDE